MRVRERWEYLVRAPKILWGLLNGRYSFQYDFMPVELSRMSLAQRWNLLRAGLNLGYRRLCPWSWPLNMQVELTSYCDLRCPVCPIGAGELRRKPVAMAPDLFERLMAEVGPYLLTVSLWAWGEPLLHPRLIDILRVARRYPFAALLSTNGQKLSDERVLAALKSEPPAYLIVALDGLCDETNSHFRRGARIQPALDGVRHLARWKQETGSRLPVLHCRFMVMKHNQHELPGLREFARGNGFDMVSIRTLSIIDSDSDAHGSFIPDSDEWRAYSYQGGQRLHRNDFICQHAFSFPTVLADGTVVACDQDYNASQPYGVFSVERSFAQIWFGNAAGNVRRIVRDDPHQYSFCRNCPYADRPISTCSIQGYQLKPAVPA